MPNELVNSVDKKGKGGRPIQLVRAYLHRLQQRERRLKMSVLREETEYEGGPGPSPPPFRPLTSERTRINTFRLIRKRTRLRRESQDKPVNDEDREDAVPPFDTSPDDFIEAQGPETDWKECPQDYKASHERRSREFFTTFFPPPPTTNTPIGNCYASKPGYYHSCLSGDVISARLGRMNSIERLQKHLFSLPPELLQYIIEIGNITLPAPVNLGSLRIRMLRRAINHRRRDIDFKVKERAQLTLSNVAMGDPLNPSPFVLSGRRVHSLRKQIDRLPKDGTADTQIDELLKQVDMNLRQCFYHYCRSIGVYMTEPFVKKDHDAALSELLGSCSNESPSGIYKVPGMNRPLRASSPREIGKAFSMYMARKAFVNHDPRSLEAKTQQFLKDVLSPPPTTPPSTFYPHLDDTRSLVLFSERQAAMIKLIRKLAKCLFKPGKKWRGEKPIPNSGKACIENCRKRGGKRELIYFRDDVPEVHRFHTLPTTIITSGKARPITIGSVYQEQYAWLNPYMFSRLRKCSWMIAGREMADWVSECLPKERLPEDEVFVSGDLLSATTLFNGVLAEEVIESLKADHGLIDEEEKAEIISGLTQSTFIRKWIDDDLVERWEEIGRQQRGQNLGSDSSFPILCLVSACIGFETLGLTDWLLGLEEKQFYTFVKNFKGMGVNGDDFVTWMKARLKHRWLDAVAISGGVPEPNKSPCNRDWFTANSQLWGWDTSAQEFLPSSFVSPSLLLNLTECTKVPQAQWLNQLSSDLFVRDLGMGACVFADVPVQVGGLGEEPEEFDETWRRRYDYCRLGKTKDVSTILDEEPVGYAVKRDGKARVGFDGGFEFPPAVRVTGLVRRDWLEEYCSRIYRKRDLIEWSVTRPEKATHRQIRDRILAGEEMAHPKSRSRFNGRLSTELHYVEEFYALRWIHENNFVFVRNKPFYEQVEVATHFPPRILGGSEVSLKLFSL